jgi:hypothetical protein
MWRFPSVAVLAFAPFFVAGCPQEPDCRADLDAWEDADGDGYGSSAAPLGKVCAIEDGMSDTPLDCDDTDPDVAPESREKCNGVDDDCDGELDEGHERELWYRDADGDGFGGIFEAVLACDEPRGDDYVGNARDCDDDDPATNPDGQEVCGGGDEDCDGMPDDADDSVDPAGFTTFYRDADGDGWGDRDRAGASCDLPQGAADNGRDCDDGDPLVGRYYWYLDADGDGYGDPDSQIVNCRQPEGYIVDNTDCDDTDPLANVDKEWYDDLDGDGAGAGAVIAVSCRPPMVGMSPDDDDCDDTDDTVNPRAADICFDGFDANCDGSDNCRTCAEWHDTDPDAPSGTYTLDLASGDYQVWCDMETDGGGWTLVANSRYVYDYSSGYYSDLSRLPNNNYWYGRGIWDGLREVVDDTSDVRFTCGTWGGSSFDVDLSVYDIHWYREWTTSTWDGDSCFNEPGGYDQPAPARRNNVTGDTRPVGDDWDAGYLRGEDTCADYGDFAIDFDERGKAPGAYQGWGVGDSTSWGSADYQFRCGNSLVYGANFWVWVREP